MRLHTLVKELDMDYPNQPKFQTAVAIKNSNVVNKMKQESKSIQIINSLTEEFP